MTTYVIRFLNTALFNLYRQTVSLFHNIFESLQLLKIKSSRIQFCIYYCTTTTLFSLFKISIL